MIKLAKIGNYTILAEDFVIIHDKNTPEIDVDIFDSMEDAIIKAIELSIWRNDYEKDDNA